VTTPEQMALQLKVLKNSGVEYVPRAVLRPLVRQAVTSTTTTGVDAAPVAPTGVVELQQLAKTVSQCRLCPALFSTRMQTVFGTGPMSAGVFFISDAPGEDDDRTGLPLQGDTGGLFDRMIGKMGLDRSDVYITSTIKCRPPQNRQPTPDECQKCRQYLVEQIRLVQPKVICCLGSAASQTLLNTEAPITALRCGTHHHGSIPVVCTYSLLYLLKNESARRPAWDDLQDVLRFLGEPGT
jgi:uracil-DNA glycosylase